MYHAVQHLKERTILQLFLHHYRIQSYMYIESHEVWLRKHLKEHERTSFISSYQSWVKGIHMINDILLRSQMFRMTLHQYLVDKQWWNTYTSRLYCMTVNCLYSIKNSHNDKTSSEIGSYLKLTCILKT